MAATNLNGPQFIYGSLSYMTEAFVPSQPVPDPDQDAGPSGVYQGVMVPDERFWFAKDSVQGNAGRVPGALDLAYLQSVDQIPAAYGTAKIAALQNVTSGTAMTLAAASVGVAAGIPIMPITTSQGYLGGGTVTTAALVLDFGFAFMTNTSVGTNAWTVADSTQFAVGMPLVIAGAGASSAALLTYVSGITDATHITTYDNSGTSVTATPVGTGFPWFPSGDIASGEPIFHLPFQAQGPAIMLDPSQAIARGVSVTGSTSATGGAFTVRGWDAFWQPLTETITAGAGATTAYGKKAFKAIASVTPGFTDAHNYSIGTSDVFGMHFRSDRWEYSNVLWAAASMTSSTGWTAADTTSPATATTGDVRGTIQTSAIGGGSGIGSNASNGTISSLAMSGRRLAIFQSLPLLNVIRTSPFNTVPKFGVAQYGG